MSEARPTSAEPASRAGRLDKVLTDLRAKAPEIEAAAVVSFDGLPMVSDMPSGMDEDRVAAMCAALLSLGERAAEGLGRGMLNQIYIEGETGTVFLVACDEEAVLVAVAAQGAKVGMMLYEVRRAAQSIADVLALDTAIPQQAQPLQMPVSVSVPQAPAPLIPQTPSPMAPVVEQPTYATAFDADPLHAPVVEAPPAYVPVAVPPAPISPLSAAPLPPAPLPLSSEPLSSEPLSSEPLQSEPLQSGPSPSEPSDASSGWSSYAPISDPTPWS